MVLTGLYRVNNLITTAFYLMLLSFVSFCFYCDSIGFYWVFVEFIEIHWVLLVLPQS